MSTGVEIRRVGPDEDVIADLANVLVDCVEGGASVGFMLPIDHPRASAYWASVLESSSNGERVVLLARDLNDASVVGTVQVILSCPENQPHRGEIAKMLVMRKARRRGIGEALMQAAEEAALQAGKTLLVLDTASGDAERLYGRQGWQRVGVVPSYALWPEGGYVDTTIFYKVLTP